MHSVVSHAAAAASKSVVSQLLLCKRLLLRAVSPAAQTHSKERNDEWKLWNNSCSFSVDANTVIDNLRRIAIALDKKPLLCASLGGNGRGVGLTNLLKPISESNLVSLLSVSSNHEMIECRRSGWRGPLIRDRPAGAGEALAMLESEVGVCETIVTEEMAELINEYGKAQNKKITVALGLYGGPTGYGYGGFYPHEYEAVRRILALDNLNIKLVTTMVPFPYGESPVDGRFDDKTDIRTRPSSLLLRASLEDEIKTFRQHASSMLTEGGLRHADVSKGWESEGAFLSIGDEGIALSSPLARLDVVNVTGSMLGIKSEVGKSCIPQLDNLLPAYSLRSRVLHVTESVPFGAVIGPLAQYSASRVNTRLSIVGCGVINAVPLACGGDTPFLPGTSVLIEGVHCPIVGRVGPTSMAVDTSMLPKDVVRVGTDVIILGSAPQGNKIEVEDWVRFINTRRGLVGCPTSSELLSLVGQCNSK